MRWQPPIVRTCCEGRVSPDILAITVTVLTLSSGRDVSIVSLRQFLHYAGLLEGLPTRRMNDSKIRRLAEEVRDADGREPFIVTPTQEPSAHEGRYPFGEPARLPAVACVAHLRSAAPVSRRTTLLSR